MKGIEKGNRIAEGNLSIMLFDGWKKESRQTFDPDHNTQNPGSNTYYVYVKNGREVRPEDIAFDIVYHQSWDALRPVVEKIGKLYEDKRCFDAKDLDIWSYSLFTPIEKVWESIIQFIQWLNQNSPKQLYYEKENYTGK